MDNYVGKRLDGRYEIREIIGVGGMAVVYKAYDNIDDRIVSVKILKDEFLQNEEFRRRFKNESKAIAVLSHPNIVKVYDVSLGDKLQYIVMEYVEGITLKEYIEQQGVLDWKEAVHFTTQILRALQHAHDKGIVHRDIKPQNIMLLENGTIKVTDFGIARFSRGETRTMTESAIGSVHYISPEQARGEITDDKADIYSVGVVLYEMITGQLPFESDNAVSVALMQVQDEATPPRQIKEDIPEGLEQITMHAMEKLPRNRYQSAAEMLLDLDELKRNPSIKFDYSYHVDKEPTRFINRDTATHTQGINTSVSGGIKPIASDYTDGGTMVIPGLSDNKGGSRKSALKGVILAILFIAILVLAFLYFFTDVLNFKKTEVPNFVGMDYAEEIDGNDKYSFDFDVEYITNSTYAPGLVAKQSPEAGQTIRSNGTVKLYVVSSGSTETIPDIYGLPVTTAESMLKQVGFTNVNTVLEYDKDAEAGTVLRSEPEQGKEADVAEVVVLYVATKDGSEQTTVPDLTGLNYYSDKSAVENLLDSRGLTVGSVTEKDSSEAKGIIISTSPSTGSKVDEGSAINLVVSSGNPVMNSVKVSITLPSSGETEECKVYVGGELAQQKNVTLDGSTFSTTVTGSGSGKKIEIYLGNQKVYSATADFSKDPVVLSNETTYDYVSTNDDDDDNGFSLFP